MKPDCSKQELFLVGLVFLLGTLLRARHTEYLAVEHFDEGVYSAGLWYAGPEGQSYPSRHLYAPPLFPTFVELSGRMPGLEESAPFLPAIVLGSLTVPLLWWTARLWFGLSAGLFVAFVAAFSDYHILFSRMALTDVPFLFWTCLSVVLASVGVQKRSLRIMAAAGVTAGLAWWTKYLGWLPLAITTAGSGFWWCLQGRRSVGIGRLLALNGMMIACAAIVFSPWYFMLQDVGGYAAVARNHGSYVEGFQNWQNNLADHIIYHIQFDSWLGAVSVVLGAMAAGTRRWIELARSTWNRKPAQDDEQTDGKQNPALFPTPRLLARFIAAALILGILATGISSFGVLTCVGIGGMAGIFLWPTLSRLYQRHKTGDLSPPCEDGFGYEQADLDAAARVDPMIGTCFVTAWFLGMVASTPMYHPFPRLSLPLLVSVWMASAAGIGWWIEAGINVVRRKEPLQKKGRGIILKRALAVLVVAALGITLMETGGPRSSSVWDRRTSLRDASWHLAEAVLQDTAGTYERKQIPLLADEQGIISAAPNDSDSDLPGSTAEYLRSLIAEPVESDTPLTTETVPSCVVYGFGEPSVLYHLHAAGLTAVPVQDLTFSHARLQGRALPTYLVLGPNALRTPGLMNDWAVQQHRFRHVADFHFAPGSVVTYNLFSPEWVAQHIEAHVQTLELYRLID